MSLPMDLISFFELRKEIPNLKLLMSNPNKDKNKFYPFVYEFLEILGITKEDIVLVTPDTKYSEVFISDSYTHGINSNLPPRKEVYNFFKQIVNSVDTDNIDRPKKIYISRRSHKHGDYSNIGTNYTDRRKLMNEDDLVIFLEKIGYTEIFTELLTTKEKILLFANAEYVIGPIGGGLCNTLFCEKETKLLSIISPNFLKINQRFSFCFDNIDTIYFEDTYHYEI
jgi:capsular polysaccharide biosynthesis protein